MIFVLTRTWLSLCIAVARQPLCAAKGNRLAAVLEMRPRARARRILSNHLLLGAWKSHLVIRSHASSKRLCQANAIEHRANLILSWSCGTQRSAESLAIPIEAIGLGEPNADRWIIRCPPGFVLRARCTKVRINKRRSLGRPKPHSRLRFWSQSRLVGARSRSVSCLQHIEVILGDHNFRPRPIVLRCQTNHSAALSG